MKILSYVLIQRCLFAGFLGLNMVGSIQPTSAQNREAGSWWPHPLWGADDQTGGSNWITPEKILSSLATVQTGKVYELGHPYDAAMPLVGNRQFELTLPPLPSGDSLGPDLVYNVETLHSQIGQGGITKAGNSGSGYTARRRPAI